MTWTPPGQNPDEQQYGQQYAQQNPSHYQAYPPAPGYGYPPYGYAPPPSNPMGVAALVCGLCGVLLFWVPFGGSILGALGISFGGAGIARRARTGAGAGMAIAGLVLGIVALLLGLVSSIMLVTGEY